MKIIWKGDPVGADDYVFRVLLADDGGIYVEELSMDLVGGEKWCIVRKESTSSHEGFNHRWLRAVSAALASMVKELGR